MLCEMAPRPEGTVSFWQAFWYEEDNLICGRSQRQAVQQGLFGVLSLTPDTRHPASSEQDNEDGHRICIA